MSIELTRDHMIIDGKKILIYGGDLSYCRIPRRLWKERIMQMKKAGMNTITFYTLWAWHQNQDKQFDFSGEKDIDAFLSLIAECGMYCIFRLGPFVHGEFRNGGLPQWLIDELGNKVRTNDRRYLDYAGAWYDELLRIAEKHLHTNGGPIIMMQLENELGSAGCKGDDLARGSADCEENTKHLLFFYNKVRSRGINLPLLDINHIPDKDKFMENLVDTGGFYPVNCFNCDGEMCNFDSRPDDSQSRPKITIETGAGMFVRYFDTPAYRNTNSFQGPLVKPEIIDASIIHHLAEGCSGINFYVFCDGQNPDNCNESMIQEKDLNYQAPITVAGRLRKSYYAAKLRGWFFRSFGEEILGSSPDDCWVEVRSCGTAHPGADNTGDLFSQYGKVNNEKTSSDNTPVIATARTTPGLNLSESNFLFIRNVFNSQQQWLRDIKVTASPSKLACEVWHEYPKKIQLEMPPDTMKIMPFFVKLCRKNFLEYSTCELLDRREFNGKTQVVLYESDEVMAEIRLVIPDTTNIQACGNVLILRESPNTVTLLAKTERMPVCVETDDLRIVLVTKKYAENLWDIGNTFAWSSSPASGNLQEISVVTEKNDFCMELFTPLKPVLNSTELNSYSEFFDAERKIYRLNGNFDFVPPAVKWDKIYNNDCIILTAKLTGSMLRDVEDIIFTFQHDGSVARAFWNGKLVSDHAYGKFLPWEIACREFLNCSGTLQIVADKASYCDVETAARKKFHLNFA